MGRLLFYLTYAWRNLRRSARWTTFAVFCIAAGVATVVALRSLGLAIGDSLVENVRQSLHGDVRISVDGGGGGFQVFNFDGDGYEGFSESVLDTIRAQTAEAGGTLTEYALVPGIQLTSIDAVTVGRPQFVAAYLIDPQTFPPTGTIRAQDPAGVPLASLFTGEHQVIVSRNLADQQGIAVGDTVRLSNTEQQFTVVGIVATELEAGITNIVASFFGFAYLPFSEAAELQIDPIPNYVSIALPDGTSDDEIERFGSSIQRYGYVDTAPEQIAQNQVIADYIGRFIVIMGLGALLIGGVGIINTMLVMVGRRSSEIAALKTFGLKGRQVFWLFMSEAFLLGVLGSIVGSVLGVLLSVVVNQYGEAFLQQGLRWRLYPEAIGYGLALGLVVTLVFGVLPILTANKVRPASILRPNETNIPRAGVFHSLIAIALVVVVIGGIAGSIIGNIPLGRGVVISGIPIGIIGVAVTLLILGVLIMLFWLIVWAVSKLPSFGIVDLRLALRNLTARRLRTATTLMALAAGMFALSAITFVGVGTREILNIQLSQNLGGNVLVFPFASVLSPTLANNLLNAGLDDIDGIQYRTQLQNYRGILESVDGVAPEFELPFDIEPSDLPGRSERLFSSLQMVARVTDNPNFNNSIVEGRGITPDDQGERVIVIPETFNDQFANVDARIGTILGIRVGATLYNFEVIGVDAGGGGAALFGTGSYIIPPGTLPESGGFSNIGFTILQVEPALLNQALLDLSTLPFVFTLDITFIDSFLGRLIQQFAAIPTVVGLLSLLAAAVTMANTVSLATLERRRQIGILKAVGLKGRRVLTIMLIENTLIGLLGGVLGIGVSALIVAAMTALGAGDAIPIPREAAPLAVALIAASVVIAWVSTFLSSNVATRERVANVLRYE
ncbi:MAG: FtsX-like permease family protein [bacterium]|nr:FtsX-like permease family protein [bacterium]